MKEVKLKFIVSKLANFYFLVDNFAEYRPLHICEYNREIIKQFGELKKNEKQAIEQYKKIMLSFQDNKKLFQNLRNYFYNPTNSSKTWRLVDKIMSKPQYKIFKNIFTVWRPRFERVWKKYHSLLKQNQRILKQNYFLINNRLTSLINKLGKFYGKKDYPKTIIEVYLTIMPFKYYYQVGITVGKNKVILSIGLLRQNDIRNINSVWKLILHELTHLLFETTEYKNLVNKYTLRKKSFFWLTHVQNIQKIKQKVPSLLREIINSSSIWNLCKFENVFSNRKDFLEIIRHKLESTNSRHKRKIIFNLNTVKQYLAWKLEPCFKKYILKNKKIDKEYLKKVYLLLFNYPQNFFRDLKQKIKGLVL